MAICASPAVRIRSQTNLSKGAEQPREGGAASNRHSPSLYSRASGLMQIPFTPGRPDGGESTGAG